LLRLRELAVAFAEANPALAPLLDGPMADPDVERLLDAVAFQNDLLSRKLDVEFPELIRNLAYLVLPHYMRPVPASTILGFVSNQSLGRAVTVPAGAQLDSTSVDGTCCRFTTTRNLEVQPLELSAVSVTEKSTHDAEIRLSFRMCGLTLSQWRPQGIRLFLAGDRGVATELYRLLGCHLRQIVLSASGSAPVILPAECLHHAGYDEIDVLAPYPLYAFPGYRLLSQYFNTPEKFLFFDLVGWEYWTERGDSDQFEVTFLLNGLSSGVPKFSRANFVLHAVPAANFFHHAADPISIDHCPSRYYLRPSGSDVKNQWIYSVDRVIGFMRQTGRERNYEPFELFASGTSRKPVFLAGVEPSPDQSCYSVYLSVAFPHESLFSAGETLSIDLTCTNGVLPENLRIGDIRTPISGIPENLAARNITPVNPGVPPPGGAGLLWQLATHIYLNHVTLGKTENLQTLLRLYLFRDNSGGLTIANRKRIAGIEEVTVKLAESMVAGVSTRGSDIHLKVRQDHFAGPGDLYLFGCVLDRFLAEYSSINCYTRLTLEELLRGESRQWPMRQE
jgi:type VI secretion system protein ImpG